MARSRKSGGSLPDDSKRDAHSSSDALASSASVTANGKPKGNGDFHLDTSSSHAKSKKNALERPHKTKKNQPSAPSLNGSAKQTSDSGKSQNQGKENKDYNKDGRKTDQASANKGKKSKDGVRNTGSGSQSTLPSIPLTPGQISLATPVWSHDGSLLLFPRSSGIRMMVRATNRPAGVLSVPPLAGQVVAISLHPRNVARLLAFTSNNHLLEFDYLDPQLLRTTEAFDKSRRSPIISFVSILVPKPTATTSKAPNQHVPDHALDDDEGVPFVFFATSDGRVLSVDLTSSAGKQHRIKELIQLPDTLTTMQVSTDGRVLVVAGSKGLYLSRTQNAFSGPTKPRTWLLIPTKYVTTAVAVPAVNDTLATGDENGVIRLWPGLLAQITLDRLAQQAKIWHAGPRNQNTSPLAQVSTYVASTAMHWHPHPVRALAYSRRDAVVLSGGEESTLVVWQIGASGGSAGNETKKEFAPRLPASITAITPVPPPPALSSSFAATGGASRRNPHQSNEASGMYAVTCSDGSTSVLSAATLRLDQIYAPEGARLIDPGLLNGATASLGIPLAVSGNLALLPGPRPASVQVVEPGQDQHLFTLETAPDNRVAAKEDILPEPVRTRTAALSLPSPSTLATTTAAWSKVSLPPWLVTAESRLAAIRSDGSLVEQEQALVFWHARPTAPGYDLASRVERPHDGPITGAAFAPPPNGSVHDPLPRLATISLDGSVRLWTLGSRPSSRGAVRSWRLGAALTFRNAQPTSMAWDARGEVLAVGWSYGPKRPLKPTSSGEQPWGALTLIDASPEALTSGSAGFLRTFPLGPMGLHSVDHLSWTSSTSVVRTLVAASPTAVAVIDILAGTCVSYGTVGESKRLRRVVNLLPPSDQRSSAGLVGWVTLAKEGSKSEEMELVALSLPSSGSRPSPVVLQMNSVGLLPSLHSILPLSVPAQYLERASKAVGKPHTVLLGLTKDLNVLAFGTAPLPAASRVLRHALSGAQPSLWAQLVGPPPETEPLPSTKDGVMGTTTRAPGPQTEAHAGLALLRPFDGPAHLLPAMGTLLNSVRQALLPPAPTPADHPAERHGDDETEGEDGDTAFTDVAAAPSSDVYGDRAASSAQSFTTAQSLFSSQTQVDTQRLRAQSARIALGESELQSITSTLSQVILEDRKDVHAPQAPATSSDVLNQTKANRAEKASTALPPPASPLQASTTSPKMSTSSTGRAIGGKSNARKRKARSSDH